MGAVQEFLHKGFARVGEWPVTDIMEEGSGNNQSAFIVRKPEAARSHVGKKHRAKRVFKPCMVGSRIDKIRKTELFYVAESLEFRGVQQGKSKILDLNIAMDRVFYDLHRFT
jgi:hypothetical protein